jgi:hypothetical protein
MISRDSFHNHNIQDEIRIEALFVSEIDEAGIHISPKDAQIAVMLLNRLLRTRGGDPSDWHRFRIFTNLGASSDPEVPQKLHNRGWYHFPDLCSL